MRPIADPFKIEQVHLTKNLVEESVHNSLGLLVDEIPCVLLNLIDLVCAKLNLRRLEPFRLLDNLPYHKNDWAKEYHGVGEDEGCDVPIAGEEDLIATHEGHDNAHDKTVPG